MLVQDAKSFGLPLEKEPNHKISTYEDSLLVAIESLTSIHLDLVSVYITTIDVIIRENPAVLGKPPPKPTETTALLDELTTGSVFIRAGTPVPRGMNLAFNRLGEWRILRGLNAFGLERRLASNGWHYFFILPSVRTTRVALSRESAIRQAVNAALRHVEHAELNSMELLEIDVRRVVGVYRVRLTAQARHIKDNPFLREPDPYARLPRVWNFRKVFDKINSERPQIKAM